MLNISQFRQFINFKNNNYKYDQILYLLPFLFLFTVISSVIGTGILNITIVIFDLLFLIFYFFNKKKINFGFNKVIILITLLFFLLNLIFSTKFEASMYGILGIFKHFIFFIGGYFLLQLDKNLFNKFIKLTFIVFIFVLIDTLIQYTFGKDIFGYPSFGAHDGRLSGPFGDELVVGSFLSKLLFISIIFFSKNYTYKIYDMFFLLISVFIIFLTNERSAAFMALLSSFIYIFFRFKSFKIKVTFFVSIFLILISLINIPNFKTKYVTRTLSQFGIIESKWEKYDNFLDSHWGAHYLTSVSIFKNYPLFGSGLKTFRYECQKMEYEKINSKSADSRCSTHPHNFYLEVLSDTGAIGFLLFLYLIFWIFKNLITLKNIKTNKIFPIILSLFFLFFWPIKTTGSILSSWNGYFYILVLIIIINNLNLIKLNLND